MYWGICFLKKIKIGILYLCVRFIIPYDESTGIKVDVSGWNQSTDTNCTYILFYYIENPISLNMNNRYIVSIVITCGMTGVVA